MQQVQSTTLRNTSAASSTTILNLSGVELSTMDFDDNTPVSACSCSGTPTDETTTSLNRGLGAVQQFAPRVSNPLTIEVPEETYDLEELSQMILMKKQMPLQTRRGLKLTNILPNLVRHLRMKHEPLLNEHLQPLTKPSPAGR